MLFLELYYFCSFYKQKECRFLTIKLADIQLFMKVGHETFRECILQIIRCKINRRKNKTIPD
jgi:hypothetical protein